MRSSARSERRDPACWKTVACDAEEKRWLISTSYPQVYIRDWGMTLGKSLCGQNKVSVLFWCESCETTKSVDSPSVSSTSLCIRSLVVPLSLCHNFQAGDVFSCKVVPAALVAVVASDCPLVHVFTGCPKSPCTKTMLYEDQFLDGCQDHWWSKKLLTLLRLHPPRTAA